MYENLRNFSILELRNIRNFSGYGRFYYSNLGLKSEPGSPIIYYWHIIFIEYHY